MPKEDTERGSDPVSVHPQYMPSLLEEFRSLKLEIMIRDLHTLSPEELLRIKKVIEELLELCAE
jgi:hypothetical protein